MEDKLIEMQEIILNNMKKLDAEKIDIQQEIARNNALSNDATAYIKSINVILRLREIAEKNNQTLESLKNVLEEQNEK